MTRAAIWCRLSRKGGRSVERQEQDGRKIAAEHGWQVVDVFSEWESASEFARKRPGNGGREQWERLLEGIEAEQYDAVIVWAEDRSNRDLEQAIEFARLCERAGVRLVLPSYNYDLADPEERNRFYGEVLNAQREAAKISKRTRRARLQEAEEGRPHPGGKRPFGFTGSGRNTVTTSQATAEQACIKEAVERILAGDSLRGIVLDWRRRGIKTSTGGGWSNRSLRQMLMSPRIAGYRSHLGQLHEATWDPAIARDQWEAVRAVLADPARKVTVGGGTPRYLLTGLVFCGVCGARMRGRHDRRRGGALYVCQRQFRGERAEGECVQRRAAPVEELIERALFDAVESPEWEEEAAERPTDDPTRPHYEALARLTGDLDVLDGMLAEAELAERQGRKPSPSVATLRRKLADREAERERHQAAVGRLQTGRVVAAIPRNLRKVWPDLSLDRRRAIIKALLRLPPEGKGIVIHPQGRGRRFDPDAIEPDWRI
jgi:site-specific DNA recombinase